MLLTGNVRISNAK